MTISLIREHKRKNKLLPQLFQHKLSLKLCTLIKKRSEVCVLILKAWEHGASFCSALVKTLWWWHHNGRSMWERNHMQDKKLWTTSHYNPTRALLLPSEVTVPKSPCTKPHFFKVPPFFIRETWWQSF
jgi:hypothetical protein